MKRTVGLIGARGYVGEALKELIANHGDLALEIALSARDEKAPADVARAKLDAWVLALPNGTSEPWVEALASARPDSILVDLSADHRFDDRWVYGQPERQRDRVKTSSRIANPGCYATAMQLALAPLVPWLEGPANVFGVSGYSGAGTKPSPKNDPEVLRDNLLPYSLVAHVHEREVARELGIRLFFMPHVAPFFRGITVTVSMAFADAHSPDEIAARYEAAYDEEPLVRLGKEAPLVRDIANQHHVAIGGLETSADGKHAVIVATIDNLLGGAATQALRNLNLALGFPERQGLPTDAAPH